LYEKVKDCKSLTLDSISFWTRRLINTIDT
jgi:hypothetical protein